MNEPEQYSLETNQVFDRLLDQLPESTQERVIRAVEQLRRDPSTRSKRLQGRQKGLSRIHVGNLVVVFRIELQTHRVYLLDVDYLYRRWRR